MSPNESVPVTAKGSVSRGNRQADERWLVVRINRILLYQDKCIFTLGLDSDRPLPAVFKEERKQQCLVYGKVCEREVTATCR